MKENSIEEDITRVKQRIEDVKEYIEYGLPYSEYLDLENSFDNILSEYKRVLKENEELEEENKTSKNITSQLMSDFINKNVIPVSLVEEKIEELKQERTLKYDNYMGYKIESREQQDIDKKVQVLQKLLEGRKI